MSGRKWRLLLLALGLLCGLGYSAWRQFAAAQRRAAWQVQQQDAEVLLDALDRPIDLNCSHTSLADFATLLTEATGVTATVDADALGEFGLDPELLLVELPLVKLPARSLLKLGLEPLDLSYKLVGGRIVITTPDLAAAVPLRVITYPAPQPELGVADAQTWADLLTKLVEPDSWDNAGGRGHCEATPGTLVVAQRPDLHTQIRAILRGLDRFRSPPPDWKAQPLWPTTLGPSDDIAQALQRPAAIDCRDASLGQVLMQLSAEHELPLFLNRKQLDDLGVPSETPITCRLSGISLKSLLQCLLEDFHLTLVVEDGVVQITSSNDAESRLAIVAYPVHDLANSIAGSDEERLIDVITSLVVANSWDRVGGTGSISAIGGWLIVKQTSVGHEQVAALLDTLRSMLARNARADEPLVLGSSAPDQRILAALEQELAIDYRQTPLTAIADDLARRLTIPVRIDWDAVGSQGRELLTAEFPAAPVRAQLKRLLAPLGLNFALNNECLEITSTETAANCQVVCVLDARPFLDADLGLFADEQFQDQRLVELLRAHPQPRSWDEDGGPGSIACFRGLLVVRQTRSNLAWLTWILAELRRSLTKRQQPAVRPIAVFDPAEQRFAAALEREIAFSFRDVPFGEACREMGRQSGVAVLVFDRLIRESAINPHALITGEFSVAPARVQLQRLCDRLGLAFDVDKDGVVVTTVDHAEERLTTRIYDVRSLVDPVRGLFAADLQSRPGGALSGQRPLIDLITAHVQPTTWDRVGGPGAIDCAGGTLLVTQTWSAHARLEMLLADLRRGHSELPAAEQRIAAALERELPLSYRAAPLAEICADLSRRLEIPVEFAERTLQEASVDPGLALSCDFPAAPVRVQLQRLLEPEGLSYTARNEVLLLTTADDAESRLTTRVFDVQALLPDKLALFPPARPQYNALLGRMLRPARRPTPGNSLADMIVAAVYPSSWDDVGGPGAIDAAGKTLVVTQTDAVHFEVAGLLAALHAHCLPSAIERGAQAPNAVWTLNGHDETATQTLPTRLYRVLDLLSPGTTLESLADRVRREVSPQVWYEEGGNATIGLVQTGWLLVAADSVTHLHVEEWLGKLRSGLPTPQSLKP